MLDRACEGVLFSSLFEEANVAQLVEQLTRNEQVSGSSPLIGSEKGRRPGDSLYAVSGAAFFF